MQQMRVCWRGEGCDATHMTAKVDLFRLKKEHRDGDDDDHYVDRNSPDPDARFGRKTPKKGFYGYKSHVVQDAESELIVQVLTTPGSVPDGTVLPILAQPQAKELTGDKAYDSKANRSHLIGLGVSPGLYPRYPRPGRPRKSWREHPKIERKFAECKQSHGLCRARYWGLTKVTIQDLLGHTRIKTTQRYCRVSNLKVQRDYHQAMTVVLQRTG